MRVQFQQRQALTEQTVVDRKVLADNNTIRINRETRQKIKGTEKEWQGRASKWLATATRKVRQGKVPGSGSSGGLSIWGADVFRCIFNFPTKQAWS